MFENTACHLENHPKTLRWQTNGKNLVGRRHSGSKGLQERRVKIFSWGLQRSPFKNCNFRITVSFSIHDLKTYIEQQGSYRRKKTQTLLQSCLVHVFAAISFDECWICFKKCSKIWGLKSNIWKRNVVKVLFIGLCYMKFNHIATGLCICKQKLLNIGVCPIAQDCSLLSWICRLCV